MAGHTPLQGDRAAWCRERLEFFSAVINNLDRERLKVELENCETEEDAAGLMHSLLWLQDNMQTHYPGGAAAIDPPEPDEPLGREFEDDIPEEHHPLYVAVDDLPAPQPVMFDPRDLNIPVDAGEPHTFLQDVVYLGNHEQQQQRQEEEDEEEEREERVDFEDYEAPPAAMCEPEVLDAARPENHTHQPLHMEEDEEEEEEEQQHQQEKQQDDEDLPLLQPLPLRRTEPPQPGPVSDLVFADALDFPHPAHMHDSTAGRSADDSSDAEEQEWEQPEWDDVDSQENTPITARSDVDTDGDTEPMEPVSDPYFDADEPSTEDFVDVEDVPLEEVVVVPSSQAEANIQPPTSDLGVEGATGGLENDTRADEQLAKELAEAINEEERRRLESDEQMARELAEQMEMEERRREEEDEELARRLAGEMEDEEMEQLQQRRQRLQENMVPSDNEDEEETDSDQARAQQAQDEEIARQMEAEVLAEIREEEDEKAGRVAALINMFPDADPTYLTERMEGVESEEAFRNSVEALLMCQRTEPRMSGHQKLLKQTHAARDREEAPPQETLGATAAPTFMLAASSNHVFECTICFEEAVPIKDVATCDALTNYHLFCIECIRKHVAALIGQGQSKFRCMNGYCEAEFSWRTLRRVMEPVVYRKVQERRQQEEVMAAGVENLVSCPFCCFMIIMPDPDNKVLECLNPECLKESCRMCKETSHIPLRCEEVEREAQKDARTMLENKMAEAMIRQCPKCGKRFVTEGGCNKMTCSCGTVMCYVCKKVITDGYNHFEQRGGVVSGKCPLWTNALALHSGEVRQAAEQGKEELDPNLRLVHDPTHDMD